MSIAKHLIWFFVLLYLFFCFRQITLWFCIIKLNHSLFPLVAACTSGEYLNGFSGIFSTPNFPNNYPQYSRCIWNITVPRGYIIKLSFLYFQMEPYQSVPAIIMLQEPELQSQMLLQMMGIDRSCCAVNNFQIQCTQWGIPFKSYSRLWAVNTQGLMKLTRLSLIVQVRGIHYKNKNNDFLWS